VLHHAPRGSEGRDPILLAYDRVKGRIQALETPLVGLVDLLDLFHISGAEHEPVATRTGYPADVQAMPFH